MSNLQKDMPATTSYGKKAVIAAMLATVTLVGSVVLTAYGIVCPTSSGACLPSGINALLSGTSVFLLVAGTLLGILGILAAVESLAVKETTSKSYVALVILLVSAVGISGNVYQFVILELVGILFR